MVCYFRRLLCACWVCLPRGRLRVTGGAGGGRDHSLDSSVLCCIDTLIKKFYMLVKVGLFELLKLDAIFLEIGGLLNFFNCLKSIIVGFQIKAGGSYWSLHARDIWVSEFKVEQITHSNRDAKRVKPIVVSNISFQRNFGVSEKERESNVFGHRQLSRKIHYVEFFRHLIFNFM